MMSNLSWSKESLNLAWFDLKIRLQIFEKRGLKWFDYDFTLQFGPDNSSVDLSAAKRGNPIIFEQSAALGSAMGILIINLRRHHLIALSNLFKPSLEIIQKQKNQVTHTHYAELLEKWLLWIRRLTCPWEGKFFLLQKNMFESFLTTLETSIEKVKDNLEIKFLFEYGLWRIRAKPTKGGAVREGLTDLSKSEDSEKDNIHFQRGGKNGIAIIQTEMEVLKKRITNQTSKKARIKPTAKSSSAIP